MIRGKGSIKEGKIHNVWLLSTVLSYSLPAPSLEGVDKRKTIV